MLVQPNRYAVQSEQQKCEEHEADESAQMDWFDACFATASEGDRERVIVPSTSPLLQPHSSTSWAARLNRLSKDVRDSGRRIGETANVPGPYAAAIPATDPFPIRYSTSTFIDRARGKTSRFVDDTTSAYQNMAHVVGDIIAASAQTASTGKRGALKWLPHSRQRLVDLRDIVQKNVDSLGLMLSHAEDTLAEINNKPARDTIFNVKNYGGSGLPFPSVNVTSRRDRAALSGFFDERCSLLFECYEDAKGTVQELDKAINFVATFKVVATETYEKAESLKIKRRLEAKTLGRSKLSNSYSSSDFDIDSSLSLSSLSFSSSDSA